MRRIVQRTAQAAFWTLAGVVLVVFLSLPANLSNLIFGSPA